MNQSLLVTKRDGTTERINLDKIHRVLDWAAEGLNNVSISQVELRSHIQFYDGIKTADIHETIIKAAADLISRDAPDYQYLAARLAIFHLRKKAFGQFEPPALYDHVVKMVEKGIIRSSSAGRLHGRRVPADGRFPRPLARHELLLRSR
ncbi:hypothetical protein QE362_004169 [Klebsiella variicola]|nr:hypothetical protein [Klebsiella variicola]